MSTTTHTPGPWEGSWEIVSAIGSSTKNIIKAHDARLYPDNERFTLAVVDPASEMPAELVESYACLISAAPEMLEALEELADLMDEVRAGHYQPDTFTNQPARAAIQKARGVK